MPGATYRDRIVALQSACDCTNSQFRCVAISAEVTEHDLSEPRRARLRHEIGGGSVGKVSVRRHDALLDGKRTLGVGLEQLLIVVSLDEEAIHFGHMMEKRSCDVSEIGENTDGNRFAPDSETHWIGRIVRDGEGGDFERFQRESAAGGKESPIGGRIALVVSAHFFRSQTCGVDRTTQRLEQNRQPAGVVAMLVGQQDGGDLRGVDSGGREALLRFAGTEARIDQDGCVTRAEHGGVAAAAAAKDDEFHSAILVPCHRGDKSAFFDRSHGAAIRLKDRPCSSIIAC